jgi:hypothetical protein
LRALSLNFMITYTRRALRTCVKSVQPFLFSQ